MKIHQVKLKASVLCPADRGEPSYRGVVTHIGEEVQRNLADVEYVWVTVQRSDSSHSKHVWPSHRLS